MKSLAITLALAVPCLWDYDTLAAEAKGLPGLAETITGRFDRFPARYYEQRLERCAEQIEQGSRDLDLFDNAGVACDRLGRGDEAIEWMRKKREILDELESAGNADDTHRYRYLANLGTFYAHRWLRSGKDRDDLRDIELARTRIAEAIELNPDAHFGRERYQLLALDWIVEMPGADEESAESVRPHLWSTLGQRFNPGSWEAKELEGRGYEDAVEGLAGLIVLGDAWGSVDIFRALELALIDHGDAYLGYLAGLRVRELLENGRGSLHPRFPAVQDLSLRAQTFVPGDRHASLDAYFVQARTSADEWRSMRNAYVESRLERGRHPDTDAGFWDDWQEKPPPKAPSHSLVNNTGKILLAVVLLVLTTGAVLAFFLLRRFLRFVRERRTRVAPG